jgi:hypothetical protein
MLHVEIRAAAGQRGRISTDTNAIDLIEGNWMPSGFGNDNQELQTRLDRGRRKP